MTISSRTSISGITLPDSWQTVVTRSAGDNNMSATVQISIDNFVGKNGSRFTLGDEIIVVAESGTVVPTTKIFTGLVEDIKFKSKPQSEVVTIHGRSHTANLMDRTVEPEVYNNLLAGSIVKDIIAKYTDDITVNNVGSSATTIARITFNHTPVFDAIKQLSEQSTFNFYVDEDKDLHFEPRSSVSSGFTFDSGNVILSAFNERRDTIFNEVWVYGDRYLDAFQDIATAGSPLGGSVFTLTNKPHNTEITVDGTLQVGGIFGVAVIPESGTDYLVNFHDKKIIFVSGTELSYSSIPASGASLVFDYKRSLAIIKTKRDDDSIASFKKRVKVIIDKNIKDPDQAVLLRDSFLAENKDPKTEGTIQVNGFFNVTPSHTCVVNLPWENVISQTYDILQAKYILNKNTKLNGNVLTLRVNKKLDDITDRFKNIEERLKQLEGADIDPDDIITRLEITTGSIGIRTSGLFVKTRTLGSSFVLGVAPHGVTGSTFGGILGSVIASGINFLGDSRSGFTIQWSGGFV